MNIDELFSEVDKLGAVIVLVGDSVKCEPAPENAELINDIKFHEQEIVAILQGKSIRGVGDCEACGSALIGLKTFDGYINRTCGNCGEWFRCFKA